MTLTDAQLELLEDCAGNAGAGFRRDYSGRGMYGETCIGVTGSTRELVGFIMLVCDEDRELADQLVRLSVDDMGIDSIWYFPHLQAPK
jgi:hypothetical protein